MHFNGVLAEKENFDSELYASYLVGVAVGEGEDAAAVLHPVQLLPPIPVRAFSAPPPPTGRKVEANPKVGDQKYKPKN